MNTLNLTIVQPVKGCRVYVDGKQLPLKRNKDGSLYGTYTTEGSEAEVAVCKQSEVSGRFWFLWAMLFFFISGFGLFNAHYERKVQTVNYNSVVQLKEDSHLRLQFNKFAEGQCAALFGSDCPIEERQNFYSVDAQTKKRFRIITLIEVLFWLALIVAAAVIVVFAIIN